MEQNFLEILKNHLKLKQSQKNFEVEVLIINQYNVTLLLTLIVSS